MPDLRLSDSWSSTRVLTNTRRIVIHLVVVPSTGYIWEVTADKPNTTILDLGIEISTNFDATGIQTMQINSPDSVRITAQLLRPWNRDMICIHHLFLS